MCVCVGVCAYAPQCLFSVGRKSTGSWASCGGGSGGYWLHASAWGMREHCTGRARTYIR